MQKELTVNVSFSKLTPNMATTLGEKIRELRERAGISLRELARKIEKSAPFLSDVELGRRYPSDEVLSKLANELNVSADELKQFDSRPPVDELKRLAEANPEVGFAFRTMIDDHRSGKLTDEELLKRIRGTKKGRK